MSTNLSMTIFSYEKPTQLDVEALRKGAFTDAISPEGLKYGWTGLGEPLDRDNFFLAQCDNRFAGFSWRQDSRKISGAVVRLQLAEKIRQEELSGSKPGAKRKKELKEAIEANLLAQAEFVPSITDCLWDGEKGHLFVASLSDPLLERILKNFDAAIHQQGQFLSPGVDMAELFAKIQTNNGIMADHYNIQPMGSAQLVSLTTDGKSMVTAENNSEAIMRALTQQMTISRMSLVATSADPEEEIYFNLADDLKISRLRLPKPEKGADADATFLINADICAKVTNIVQTIAQAE